MLCFAVQYQKTLPLSVSCNPILRKKGLAIMAKAVVPRIQGDDYQARWFWVQACRLFEDHTKVIRVAYEKDNIKSFDDVVVFYTDGMLDHYDGHALSADYYQVKFHVTAAGDITWKGMMDPAFINATSVSILQRLKNAQEQYAPNGLGCRFHLYTPWPVSSADPLAEVLSQTDGRIIWSNLAVGTSISKMGKVRAAWRDHLGINTDEELQIILRPLRITFGYTLQRLRETLNDKLQLAGLAPVDDGCLVHPYDDLTRKLLQTGQTEFTRASIEAVCKQEKLWRGRAMPEPGAYRVGIRSFLRWAEYLEDETEAMLCLLKYFDGRKITSPDLWHSHVFPEIDSFISRAFRTHQCYHLHLHTHASITFAAGYCLDPKAGVDVALVQSGLSGRELWRPEARYDPVTYATWAFSDTPQSPNGSDTAVALSVTHNVFSDVSTYVAQSLPQVRKLPPCHGYPPP
jgi:hypothetical protein